jgi:ribulose-5-phosphate 4-epimerase/fuculose-1-phosphate aldolase
MSRGDVAVLFRDERIPESGEHVRCHTASETFVEFDLDSRPVEGITSTPVAERYIHGEIYKARPDVMAVVHCHAPSVIPFSVSSIALRPVFVAAAFIGAGLPVFKSGDVERPENMVIDRGVRGRAVALVLAQNPAVLMRGHGAAVVAPSLKSVVVRTYYLDMNARLQAQAILLGGKVNYIEPPEPGTTLGDNYDRVWDFWKRKVKDKWAMRRYSRIFRRCEYGQATPKTSIQSQRLCKLTDGLPAL